MKKVLSVILTAVMLLSSFVVFALPSSAVIDGEWTVLGGGIYENADGETAYDKVEYTPDFYAEDAIPMAGYEYRDDGFKVLPTDFTNWNPKIIVASKEKMDISDGFEMEVRIDEYAWGGKKEDGTDDNKDHWISFSIWDAPRCAQGSNDAGNGWFCLVRRKTQVQEVAFVNSDEGFNFAAGTPALVGGAAVPLDERDGHLYYTFKIEHNGDTYDMYVNGVKQTSAGQVAVMNKTFADGMAYIGFTMQTGAQSTACECTVTKVNGVKPTGEDSRASGENTRVIADIADSSTVGENQPCLIYDGTMQSFNRLSDQGGLKISINDDERKSLHAIMNSPAATITWAPKSSLSYEASDFPYLAILFKNFCTCPDRADDEDCYEDEAGFTIWPYAGDRATADDDYIVQGNYFDERVVSGTDDFKYGIYDLSDETLWKDRINGVRLDFGGMPYQTAGRNAFDICFIAFFRSEEEAKAYIEAYIGKEVGKEEEDTTDPDNPSGDVTEEPTSEKETEAKTETKTETTTESSGGNRGCKSVAGIGSVAVAVVAFGTGVVTFKKKRK